MAIDIVDFPPLKMVDLSIAMLVHQRVNQPILKNRCTNIWFYKANAIGNGIWLRITNYIELRIYELRIGIHIPNMRTILENVMEKSPDNIRK